MILLLLASLSFAAEEAKSKYVTIHPLKPLVIREGKTEMLSVSGVVLPGLHIQSNPASSPNLIPTEVKFEAKKGIETGKPTYPKSKTYRLKNSDKDMATFDGAFEIKVPVTAALAKVGKYDLSGQFRFQACNDTTCFFPEKLPLKVSVRVKK